MYTITPSGKIRKQGVVIPSNDTAPEYREYVEWLKQGNGPEQIEDTEQPRPRITVSAWQIRKALNALNLRAQVENAVAASTNIELKDGWEYSPNFFSDQPMTLAMGAALGKNEADMYALFQLAESL